MRSDPRRVSVTAQDVVDLLNEAAKLDPLAVRGLIDRRVWCNNALAEHPTIQVGPIDKGATQMEVGLLGILNGIFGTFDNGWGCITSLIDDDPAVPIKFEVRDHSEKP